MSRSSWQYYAQFYRGSLPALFLSIGLSIGQSLFVLPITFLVRYIFDTVIPTHDSHLLILVGAALLLLHLMNSGMTLWTRHLTLRTTKRAIQNLREELLARCYLFSPSYYRKIDRGQLHASIVQHAESLDWMSNALVALLLPALVMSVVISAVLIFLNGFLFLILVTVTPLLLWAHYTVGKKVKKHTSAFHRSFETFSKGMLFVLQMMDLTRIQTAELFECERQKKNIEALRVTSGSMAWWTAAYASLQRGIMAISSILILVIGGMAVASGSMSLGSLISFYVGVSLLNGQLNNILTSIPQIIAGNQSLNILYHFSNLKEVEPYRGHKRISFRGGITFESVNFQYGNRKVLRNIDFTLRPGSVVALFGPNGSGKTTLAHLILGFYRPQEGQIFADGYPYDEIDLLELRRSMAMVTQDPILFSGTIWENITYGFSEATLQQVHQAAALALADKFIQAFPHGYDTVVGEQAGLLSGGERQRIALARALLRQPKLLILDEPTNHLDHSVIHPLMDHLMGMRNATTILLISHDLDVLCAAELVYVLEDGQIERRGSPGTIFSEMNPAREFSGEKRIEA